MSRLTRLESAVLDALAWELEDVAPDLAGQVEESLPGLRRNTGQGLYTELIVARGRPLPGGVTGRFGTTHAMVGDLPDPIGFQVELREGRLMALHGQSYGQDTRAIDFATIPFEEVFTVDDQGESVLFDPAALMPESPLRELQRTDEPPTQPLPDPFAEPADRWERLQQGPARNPLGVFEDIKPGKEPLLLPGTEIPPIYLMAIVVAAVMLAFAVMLRWVSIFIPLALLFLVVRFAGARGGRPLRRLLRALARPKA